MKSFTEINIQLQDKEWPLEYIDHDRHCARAIIFDDDKNFYFVHVDRDDYFGKAKYIESSGGGVEKGENLEEALKRELKEELGLEAQVICKIGIVSDYYNIIHRHNINHYFLCKAISFGPKKLTKAEIECFHLTSIHLKYDQAIQEYIHAKESKIGRLVSERELPVLQKAKEIIEGIRL
ncbi:MAG: NUDIX hydrolase [Treponema sp.]|nr:NUDIX hydrolase [Treponema sp.]